MIKYAAYTQLYSLMLVLQALYLSNSKQNARGVKKCEANK